ncbi:hypothetical protein JW758_01590 [Candidatus Peregrinibacteria bacterium]|nr:hypothetical protein [Candidatus Peregrinibacteria bacterium]
MKKLAFIFLILFILVIATGCSARRNTVHFDPNVDKLSADITEIGTEDSNNEDAIIGETTTVEELKGPDFSIDEPILENNKLNTNTGYHVIKGKTPKNTDAITVNDYRLTKYIPGQTEWSYIASDSIGTLSEGDNQFSIRSFDKEGNEIGAREFTISYTPAEIPALPSVGLNSWLVLIYSIVFSGLYFTLKRLRKVFIKK